MQNVIIRVYFSPVAVLALFLLTLPSEAQVVADSAGVNAAIEGSVSVGVGATSLKGSDAAFQERFQHVKDGFGGVEDLRYRRDTKQSSLSLDGHAEVADGNYRFNGRWAKNDTLYVNFGYDRYSVFYDGNGNAFQPTDTFLQVADPKLRVNQSRAWIELGYTPENRAQFKIRYERTTRSGEKPSTEFGDTNLTGAFGTRSIVPSFLYINESRNVVTADASRVADNYQWQAGLRYEHNKIDDGRENDRRPFEAANRVVTSKDASQSDLFSGHGFVERRVGEKLVVSAGGLVTTLDTNIGGSRIYGADYDAIFDPLFARRQSGDLGFLDLAGGAELKEYVFNLNAVYTPSKNWVIQPALRYEHLHIDNVSTFVASSVGNSLSTSLQDLETQSQKQENQLTETLEVRYTGRPSWNFSLRGEWFQTMGNLTEFQFDQVTSVSNLDRDTDYRRNSQKYTLDAHWYARPGLTFTGEYYYKLRMNNYDALRDSTPAGPGSFDRYPAFITSQKFATHDVNFRLSWRPLSTLSLVTRYDFQYTTNVTNFMGVPETDNGRMTTHIISQSFTWNPIASLYLTSSANLTYNQLGTPASAFVSNSDNNYVNVSLGAGYALGKITDLFLDGNHYLARDYTDNSARTLPLGADQKTDDISLTWVRRQTERLIYTVKYTYAMNRDGLAGGNNDYRANLVYAKVQYKF